jgi:hypothetical protein
MIWLPLSIMFAACYALARPWLDRAGYKLGWALARPQIERERISQRLHDLCLETLLRQDRPTGISTYAASPHRGGLPGEHWRPGHGWESYAGPYLIEPGSWRG